MFRTQSEHSRTQSEHSGSQVSYVAAHVWAAPASGTSYGTADVSDRNVASPLCHPTPECALTDPTAPRLTTPLTSRVVVLLLHLFPVMLLAGYRADAPFGVQPLVFSLFCVLPRVRWPLSGPPGQCGPKLSPKAIPRDGSARGESTGLAGMVRDTPS